MVVELRKELGICEVRATNVSNASFRVVLEGRPFGGKDSESNLTLDVATCARYKIPKALRLVRRTLVCTFQSRELSLQQEGKWKNHVDFKAIENDDLEIELLRREETITSNFDIIPPRKFDRTSRTLVLSSFGKGDGIHLHIIPCPFYRFVLDLTDEEYEACKALPANSAFKANFHLK